MENEKDSRRFAPTVEDILEYMPTDFVTKHQAGDGAAWNESEAGDWWPSRDGDNWTQYAYVLNFRTEEGQLYAEAARVDQDGDWDTIDEAEVGTDEFAALDHGYFNYEGHDAAWLEYENWCYEHGEDPLDQYAEKPVSSAPEDWKLRFRYSGSNSSAIFLSGWRETEPGLQVVLRRLPAGIRIIVKSTSTNAVRRALDMNRGALVAGTSDCWDFEVSAHVTRRVPAYKTRLRKQIRTIRAHRVAKEAFHV